jgi:hypothetical protein
VSSEPDLASSVTEFHEAARAATDPVRTDQQIIFTMLLRLAQTANTELAQIEDQLHERIAKIERATGGP